MEKTIFAEDKDVSPSRPIEEEVLKVYSLSYVAVCFPRSVIYLFSCFLVFCLSSESGYISTCLVLQSVDTGSEFIQRILDLTQ